MEAKDFLQFISENIVSNMNNFKWYQQFDLLTNTDKDKYLKKGPTYCISSCAAMRNIFVSNPNFFDYHIEYAKNMQKELNFLDRLHSQEIEILADLVKKAVLQDGDFIDDLNSVGWYTALYTFDYCLARPECQLKYVQIFFNIWSYYFFNFV